MLDFTFKNISHSNSENMVFKLNKNKENILISINNYLLDVNTSVISNIILINIFALITSFILDNLVLENSFYIPSERLEIVNDRKLLTRFIQDRSNISKNQSDILAAIQQLDPAKKSEFYSIACKLEEEISGYYV